MGEAGIKVKVTETTFEGALISVPVFGNLSLCKLTACIRTCVEHFAAGSPVTVDLYAKLSLMDPTELEVNDDRDDRDDRQTDKSTDRQMLSWSKH